MRKVRLDNDSCIKYFKNGDIHYLKFGKPNRLDGPALILATGTVHYYVNGERHRLDGPAIEFAHGDRLWYINGLCHRIDGPAVEYNGGNYSWYYYGKYIECSSQEQFERLIRLRLLW